MPRILYFLEWASLTKFCGTSHQFFNHLPALGDDRSRPALRIDPLGVLVDAEMMNDELVTTWTSVPQPYTDADARTWITELAPAERTEGRGIVFAVTEFLTQRLVGIVHLQNIRSIVSRLAEEAVQETFVRAYRAIRTMRRETKLSTWLFGIARNVARVLTRKKGSAPER